MILWEQQVKYGSILHIQWNLWQSTLSIKDTIYLHILRTRFLALNYTFNVILTSEKRKRPYIMNNLEQNMPIPRCPLLRGFTVLLALEFSLPKYLILVSHKQHIMTLIWSEIMYIVHVRCRHPAVFYAYVAVIDSSSVEANTALWAVYAGLAFACRVWVVGQCVNEVMESGGNTESVDKIHCWIMLLTCKFSIKQTHWESVSVYQIRKHQCSFKLCQQAVK